MSTNVFVFLTPPSTAGTQREAYPYGPAPSGSGFNTDLGVEIGAAVSAQTRALAVVSGLARIIPDTAPATCTLVLKPSPLALRDLRSIIGNGVVVFIYRNLTANSVKPIFQQYISALGNKGFLETMTLDQRADAFMQGQFPVSVDGGNDLGLSDARGAAAGWTRLGFEIACIPNGMGPVGSGTAGAGVGWDRLVQLVAPTNSATRRLDPASFYAQVKAGTTDAVLAPAHASHALLSVLTRRTLLEVRDEYDRPYVGSINVMNTSTGSQSTQTFTAANRGTVSLKTIAVGSTETPANATYSLALVNNIFSELPSGSAATENPSKTMMPPAHWAVQTIFMADVNDDKNWFIPNIAPLPRFTQRNSVTPLVDGVKTLHEYVDAMRTVKSAGHFMYLAAWFLSDSFQLIPGDTTSTMTELSRAATTANADVRALLWDQPGTQNSAEVDHINALPGGHGRAILDNNTLDIIVGSHHQKFLVLNGAQGAFAFCGGVDINPDRLDSPHHGAEGAFHDVHAKVEGPAVADIHRSFVDRWNAHPSVPPALPTAAPPFRTNAGSVYVQVARTYPPKKRYTFAPNGSLTPLDAITRAIRKANKFIYLEDQYLTPYPGRDPAGASGDTVGILTELRAALPRIDYLLMVIPNHSDLPQNRFRRQQFIEGLRAVDASKVFVFFLGRSSTDRRSGEVATAGGCSDCSGGENHRDEIYCHSKTWIVDDVWAKIGSANCNRRSYTYDSEMDIVMVDGALSNGARAVARSLRKELWGEHLNMVGRTGLLEDHLQALSFWKTPPPGAHIRPYEHNAEIEAIHLDLNWDGNIDPDGR
jgi:phosphatidylserine/phosphatidylglycerophosphate/cardiolipin synthase-like enzyme